MHKPVITLWAFNCIHTKISTLIGLWTTKTCLKFQLNRSTHLQVIAIFLQSVQIDEEDREVNFCIKIYWFVSREWLKELSSNVISDFPSIESNSTANFVPFGLDLMEVRMHERRNFVLSVNILTVLFMPHFLWLHTRPTTVSLAIDIVHYIDDYWILQTNYGWCASVYTVGLLFCASTSKNWNLCLWDLKIWIKYCNSICLNHISQISKQIFWSHWGQ